MATHLREAVNATYVAGADLSSNQYMAVKLNTSGEVVAVAAVTDVPIGILNNAPKQGEAAEVVIIGGAKIVAAGAIALPAVLGVDANGKAKKLTVGTDTTQYVIGQAESATAASGEIVSAIVNFATPSRAA